MAKKTKYPPPQTRNEGANRINKSVQYVYDYKGSPSDMAAAMLDATFQMIDGVGNPLAYHALLQEALQKSYERLKTFEG